MDEKIFKEIEKRYNILNLEIFLKERKIIEPEQGMGGLSFLCVTYKYYPCVYFSFNDLNYEFCSLNELSNNNSIGIKEIDELEEYIKATTFKENLDKKLIEKEDKIKRIKI